MHVLNVHARPGQGIIKEKKNRAGAGPFVGASSGQFSRRDSATPLQHQNPPRSSAPTTSTHPSRMRQTTIPQLELGQRYERADMQLAELFYISGIPSNVARTSSEPWLELQQQAQGLIQPALWTHA